jgi:hypothetical protein
MSILELLHHIVNEPAPRLVSRSREFPASATSFIENCLDKEPSNRKSPQELLVSASKLYISKLTRTDLGLGGFRQSFCRRYPGMGKEDGCCRGGVMGDQSVFRVLTLICICLFIRLVTTMYSKCTLVIDLLQISNHRFLIVMLLLGIFSLMTAVALPNVNISPLLLTRVASIVLLYAAALSFNALDIQAIGSGVSI